MPLTNRRVQSKNILAACFVIFFGVQASLTAAMVDLDALGLNWNFESPDLGGNTSGEQFSSSNMGPGWIVSLASGSSNNYGVQDPPTGFYGSSHPLPSPFLGDQFGFVNLTTDGTEANVDSISLGPLLADSVYTLSVAVGERGPSTSYDIDYAIGLLANGVEIGSFATGNTTNGDILDLTYTLDTAMFPGNVGEDFSIRINGLRVSGPSFSQMNFDNVRLEVVPEPSTLVIFGAIALVGLSTFRRRRLQRS